MKTACSDETESNANKKIKIDDSEHEAETIDLNEEENNENEIVLLNQIANRYGIVERVNKTFKRFFGLAKQSSADFIVNEIGLDGNVIRLTDFELPVLEKKPEVKENADLNSAVEKAIGTEKFKELIQFLESNSTSISFKIEAPKEKSDRKLVHDFIKSEYKKFNSNTVIEDGKQMIEISHHKSNRNTSSRDCFKNNSNKVREEMGDSKILLCSMYKENIDTIQAVSLISRQLRINPKRIGYAGTKDKRGKTTQLLSFFKIEPTQIQRLNKNFHNIKLGNFKLRNGDGLRLGDLSGNRFKIVIREIDEQNNSIIESGIESLKKNGFINYFGLQRFGSCTEAPTHLIGKLLILNKVKDAIELILKPRDGFEKEEVKIARHTWKEKRDAKQAYACIEKINCVEKFLFKGLCECGSNDVLGAFQYLPRNMRLMYLHAYQSYIWNKMVTKRFELYGFETVLGDLVRKDQSDEIIVLDDQIIGNYSIDQVVLPLPGHSIKYPNNDIKKCYEELLAKDGIEIDGLKNRIKEFSLNGDYRNILTKPQDLKYEIIDYNDKIKELTKSDWDLIKPIVEQHENGENNPDNNIKYKAVVVEYSLQSSSYATMALRELLKDN